MASLGHEYYLAALKQAAVVIGNTSSGIIEAPAAGAPTVNIGIRQEGRRCAPSVVELRGRGVDDIERPQSEPRSRPRCAR